MKQRDLMRELFARHGDKEELIVPEYARAEREGEVQRLSNARRLSSEDYARRLFYDGKVRGWIKGDNQ